MPDLPTSVRPRVLLVDDRNDRRALMRVVVETGASGGTVVAEAADPVAAASAASRTGYDVAVVEVGMPVGVGLEVIAALRAGHPTLPIVVCSFRSDVTTRAEAFAAGASAYLAKPVSPRDLHRACTTLIQAAAAPPPP